MKDHWVTLPRPANERELLLAVRRGEWSQDRVIKHANRLLMMDPSLLIFVNLWPKIEAGC